MSWDYFILFAIVALICWGAGAYAAWKGMKPGWAYGFTLLGLAVFSVSSCACGFRWNARRCGRWERLGFGILSSFRWRD